MAGRKSLFDRKFGPEYIKAVPLCAGVYEVLNEAGDVIYVGKAKILRRRLQQYRNAKRRKKHLKMRAIVSEAHNIRITPCENDVAAQILENELIQKLRPRYNIAGAFSFLYPMLGLRREGSTLYVVYTTQPQDFTGFEYYGAFRSRYLTRNAYYALLEVLTFIGHRESKSALKHFPVIKYSHVAGFRQIDPLWMALLERFLIGETPEFLSEAVLALVERPMARRYAEEVQEHFDALKRFFKFEAKKLRAALIASNRAERGISQQERDILFIKSRNRTTLTVSSRAGRV